MSYTRTFSKDIRISYSGTVSYPPSKTGGVRTYSGNGTCEYRSGYAPLR